MAKANDWKKNCTPVPLDTTKEEECDYILISDLFYITALAFMFISVFNFASGDNNGYAFFLVATIITQLLSGACKLCKWNKIHLDK